MPALNPYLNFNGNTEEVFNFYKSVFGGEFSMVMRFKDMPKEYQDPADNGELIMHMALPITGGNILMGSDVPRKMGKVSNGNNFNIAINAESKEEAERLFNGLSAGGSVLMPLMKPFWGAALFGMFTDKYGISWMVSLDETQQS